MKRFFPAFVDGPGAVGLLVLRLVMGAAFVLHGWGKVQAPFSWMGPNSPIPGILQALAALAEFGGGLALAVGVLTPLAALGLACTMGTALAIVHLPQHHAFVGAPGSPSYEIAAVYLACSVLFLLAGPGRLSADAFLFGRTPRGLVSRTF